MAGDIFGCYSWGGLGGRSCYGIQCMEARDAETSYNTQDNLLHKELSIPKYQ